MKYLLDTHTLIWWAANSERLYPEFRNIIKKENNIILVSVATIWEIIIKVKLKKLKIKTLPEEMVRKCGFTILDIELEHVLSLRDLPNYHKDPFDRILIAQSKSEDCELLTTDKKVKKYF